MSPAAEFSHIRRSTANLRAFTNLRKNSLEKKYFLQSMNDMK